MSEEIQDKKKSDLNALISSEGWLIVEGIKNKEIEALKNIDNINDTLSPEIQAIQIKANKGVIKSLNNIFDSIKAQARVEKIKRQELL